MINFGWPNHSKLYTLSNTSPKHNKLAWALHSHLLQILKEDCYEMACSSVSLVQTFLVRDAATKMVWFLLTIFRWSTGPCTESPDPLSANKDTVNSPPNRSTEQWVDRPRPDANRLSVTVTIIDDVWGRSPRYHLHLIFQAIRWRVFNTLCFLWDEWSAHLSHNLKLLVRSPVRAWDRSLKPSSDVFRP